MPFCPKSGVPMFSPNSPTPAHRHARDMRAHVSNPLGQSHRPAHARDLRITCACWPLAARVVGVRLSAPTPHRTHAAMSTPRPGLSGIRVIRPPKV
jgi:hypothetical protein